MSLPAGIFSLLSGGSTTAESRIYPLREPENPAYPLVLYHIRAAQLIRSRDADDDDERLDRNTVVLDLVGETYNQVDTLAGEIRRVVNGYAGTVGGQHFTRVWLEDVGDSYNPDERKHEKAMTLVVWHKETI